VPRVKSQAEQDASGGDFTLMPEDRYLVEIKEFKVENKPDTFNNGALRDVGACKLTVISFEDGSEVVDVDDVPQQDRLLFDYPEISRLGFSQGGTMPSKGRQFLTAAFGLAPTEAIDFEDWQELVGKRLIAIVKIKTNQKGVKQNKVAGYEPIKTRRRGRPASGDAAADIAAASTPRATMPGESLAAKAADIFGDEADFGFPG